VAVAPGTDPAELEDPPVSSEPVVLPPLSPTPVPPDPPTPPVPPGPPGSLVGVVVSVGSVDGSVVDGVLLLVGGSVVGGTVPLVGGAVVVGAVVLGGLRRALVGGGSVVEVVARPVLGTVTVVRWRVRVVVEAIELAGETCWCCRRVVVVVVCAVACAGGVGEVTRPTTLPPIAPISIAVTTLTHRRAATNAMGRNRRTPPVRVSRTR
jgi:hypothetical protein